MVTIKVFNIIGEKIAKLVDNEMKPGGWHTIIWNGKTINGNIAPSGIYFLKLITESQTISRKMTLLK